jgi:hypothetical protein
MFKKNSYNIHNERIEYYYVSCFRRLIYRPSKLERLRSRYFFDIKLAGSTGYIDGPCANAKLKNGAGIAIDNVG